MTDLVLSSTENSLKVSGDKLDLILSSSAPELRLSNDDHELVFSHGDFGLLLPSQRISLELSADGGLLLLSTPVPVGTGEANTLANGGTGGISLVASPDKVGVALQVRSVGAGAGIDVTESLVDDRVDFSLEPGIQTFSANCLVGDAVGSAVYVLAETAGTPEVRTCAATALATMPSVGVLIDKPTATTCTVQRSGILTTSGLVAGTRYWVGDAGLLTATIPTPGIGEARILQSVGIAISSTKLLLDPQTQILKRVG